MRTLSYDRKLIPWQRPSKVWRYAVRLFPKSLEEAIVHTKHTRNARIAMVSGGERNPRSGEVGMLKWVYHLRSEHPPPQKKTHQLCSMGGRARRKLCLAKQ